MDDHMGKKIMYGLLGCWETQLDGREGSEANSHRGQPVTLCAVKLTCDGLRSAYCNMLEKAKDIQDPGVTMWAAHW